MTLIHYYGDHKTAEWRVRDKREAADIIRRIRGAKTLPRFTSARGWYEVADGPSACYELYQTVRTRS